MGRPYQLISFEQSGDIFCVRLPQSHIGDVHLEELGAEIARLIDEENCRRMVLNLGPEDPNCLISVFLAKLINVQRRLEANGGALVLAQASEHTRSIFRIAGIEKFFRFAVDQATAIQSLSGPDVKNP